MVRVFANGPGDRGSVPGRVIPKTQKWYLPISVISYETRVKWSNPEKRIFEKSPGNLIVWTSVNIKVFRNVSFCLQWKFFILHLLNLNLKSSS